MGFQTVSSTIVVVLSVLNLLSNRALVVGQTSFSFPEFWVEETSILKSPTDAVFKYGYEMTSQFNAIRPVCGRIVYKDKVRMKDRASGKVASFNTTFVFRFLSQETTGINNLTCGYGMVFTFTTSPNFSVVLPPLDQYSSPIHSYINGMCTFDIEDKLVPSNRTVFAVKFDSLRSWNSSNDYVDPSDGNIGVVISNKGNTTVTHYNLCGAGVTNCRYFCGDKGEFTAWIDYDSAAHTLEVRFRYGNSLSSNSLFYNGTTRPNPVLTMANVVLDEVVDEEMYVGFTSSTQNDSRMLWENHRIEGWIFDSSGILPSTSPAPSPTAVPSPIAGFSKAKSSQAAVIAGICVAIFGAALMGLLCLFCNFKHRTKTDLQLYENSAQHSTSTPTPDTYSRAYTFKELRIMTKSFSDSELLSSGAFGDVYKGTPPSTALVAIKRIKHTKEHSQASFLAEVNSLRQIRHRSLLQLRGWCEAKEGLFLVYDFMSNGSLDKWLHANPKFGNQAVAVFEGLSWDVRRSILTGVASALEYLHEDCAQCILHRDIKSSNVMLDENFNPYLGDFGLARLVDHNKRQKTTMVAGTLGYMAPEMHFTGRATKETDVYAFGMLVLEVVCARTPFLAHTSQFGDQAGDFLLLERVWRAHEEGDISNVVDPRLLEDVGDISVSSMTGYECGQLEMIAESLELGLLCCLPNPSERPSMRMVNQWFQSREAGLAMEFPCLPATKPVVPGQYTISLTLSLEETTESQS